jgi:hypothetical protein
LGGFAPFVARIQLLETSFGQVLDWFFEGLAKRAAARGFLRAESAAGLGGEKYMEWK